MRISSQNWHDKALISDQQNWPKEMQVQNNSKDIITVIAEMEPQIVMSKIEGGGRGGVFD